MDERWILLMFPPWVFHFRSVGYDSCWNPVGLSMIRFPLRWCCSKSVSLHSLSTIRIDSGNRRISSRISWGCWSKPRHFRWKEGSFTFLGGDSRGMLCLFFLLFYLFLFSFYFFFDVIRKVIQIHLFSLPTFSWSCVPYQAACCIFFLSEIPCRLIFFCLGI